MSGISYYTFNNLFDKFGEFQISNTANQKSICIHFWLGDKVDRKKLNEILLEDGYMANEIWVDLDEDRLDLYYYEVWYKHDYNESQTNVVN